MVDAKIEAVKRLASRGLSDPQIAAEINTTVDSVRYVRRKHGIKTPVNTGVRNRIVWLSLDWDLTNREIATEIRANIKTVERWRRKLGKELPKRKDGKATKAITLKLPVDVAKFLESKACADVYVTALIRQAMRG